MEEFDLVYIHKETKEIIRVKKVMHNCYQMQVNGGKININKSFLSKYRFCKSASIKASQRFRLKRKMRYVDYPNEMPSLPKSIDGRKYDSP